MEASIANNVRWAYVAVALALSISTLIAVYFRRTRPSEGADAALQRIQAWWLMAALFAVATVGNRFTSMFLFAVVSFLALKEFFTLMPMRRVDRSLLFWTYATNPVQYYLVGTERFALFVFFIPVFVFLFLPVHTMLTGNPRGFLRAVGTLHWGVMTTVFGLSHVAYLLLLPGETAPHGAGAGLVIFLLILTELNTLFQWLWRHAFKARKILPRINPAKTWSGLTGGVLSTILLSMLMAPHLTPLGTGGAFLAGLLIGVGGFFGDVTISLLKRDLRIRETGHWIPGFGGVLDRVDSLTYTAPLFFYFVRTFYYG